MKSSKSTLEAQFGPLQKKTFGSALSLFFEQQCPQMGGHLTRQVLVNNVQKLVDEFYPANTHLRMGQVMWPAVDENEHAAYGKTIGRTKIKPVFVDMIAPEDIEATLLGEKKMKIRQKATIRLFNQAKQQGGVLTGVDAATMMRLSPATSPGMCGNGKKSTRPVCRGAAPSTTWDDPLLTSGRSVIK
jgi:hypothetical protein